MARISGVNIPTNKRIHVALTYIFGIGPKIAENICTEASIDISKRVNQLNDNDCGGNIIKYGGAEFASSGRLCYLSGSGNWQPTDAGRAHSGSYNMLAIAMGSTPSTDGMLLEGFYKLPSNKLTNNPASDDIGKPVYMASGSSAGIGMGKFTLTAPSGSSEVVRVVGHCIDIDSDDVLLYFKPDSTSIILS